MKWSDSIFWGVICGILVLYNIYSFYQKKNIVQDLKTVEASISEKQEEMQLFVDNEINRQMLQYQSEGNHIDENLPLSRDTEEKSQSGLGEQLSNNWTLVFDLSSISCTKCVEQQIDKEIELLKEFSNKVGSNKVLVLARYRNPNDLDLFKRLNDFELKIYNKEDRTLGLPVEQHDIPYMFLADSTFKAQFVFIPDENLPTLSEDYFRYIEQKF